MRDGYRFKDTEISSGFPPIVSVRFILCFRQDALLLPKGLGYRGIVLVFCQRSGLLFKLLDASQNVIVVRK